MGASSIGWRAARRVGTAALVCPLVVKTYEFDAAECTPPQPPRLKVKIFTGSQMQGFAAFLSFLFF